MIGRDSFNRIASAALFAICVTSTNGYCDDSVPKQMNSELGKDWPKFGNHLGEVGQKIHQLAAESGLSQQAQQQGEIDEHLLWGLIHASLYYSQMDPDNPDWLPFANSSIRYTDPNPDAIYYLTRIRGSGVYRITGTRGTVKLVDLQVNNGFVGFNDHAPTISNLNFNDIEIAKDNTFEIIASAARPAGYKGNWLRLDPKVDDTFLLVRQISYDWLHEEDARFLIQRIDTPVNQQRRNAEEISGRIGQIPDFIDRMAKAMIRIMVMQKLGKREPNQLEDVTHLFDNQPINKNQAYYSGDVKLTPDEALVLEVAIPKQCPYWSVQLFDSFYNTLDHMFHQTSINGHTARIDPDGKARIVVSLTDPGVANWLDASGYQLSGMMGRWYKCGDEVPKIKKVGIAEVRKYLHPTTPTITFEQRQKMLRDRIAGAQHRRRW